MADIFVSYSSDDRTHAQRLAAFLEDNGHTVWWDRELVVGGDFEEEIDRQLKSADIIIVCWSVRSAASHWVKSEANEGMRTDRLIPVKLDKTPVPRPFDQLTTLDLSKWSDEAGQRLLAAIGDVPEHPTMSAFQKARQRGRVIALATVACLALVFAGLWGPVTSWLTPKPAEAVPAYEKPRISEAATRHILRRLNDTGRQTSDAAFALIQTGDVHDAIRLLETKYNEMGPDTPKEEEAALLHQIGALAFDYDPAKAHGVYQSLVLLAPDDPLALEQSGKLFRDRGNIEEARVQFQRAAQVQNLSQAQDLDLAILSTQLKFHDGALEDVTIELEELAKLADQPGLENQRARALRHGAIAKFLTHDLAGDLNGLNIAKDMVNEAIVLQKRIGNEVELADNHTTLGFLVKLAGDYDEARFHYDQAFRIGTALNQPQTISLALGNLANLTATENKFEEAEQLYRKGLQNNTEHGLVHLQAGLWLGLAVLAEARGDATNIICEYALKASTIQGPDSNTPNLDQDIQKWGCST